jgi:hypothetical protein
MNLSEIIDEIKKTKPLAEENLETGHYSTLNARRGRQARAIETMKELTEAYAQTLTRSSVFVLVAGALKNDFASLALQKKDAFGADPEDFYKELLKEIHPSMYQSGPSNILDILGRVIENKMLTLNVREYNQIQYKATYSNAIKGEAEVLQLIKDSVNDQIGSEIAGANAIRTTIVPEAIKRGYGGGKTPIILTSQDEKLTLKLVSSLTRITPDVFLVVAGRATKDFKIKGAIAVKEATEESVNDAMKTIMSQVNRV